MRIKQILSLYNRWIYFSTKAEVHLQRNPHVLLHVVLLQQSSSLSSFSKTPEIQTELLFEPISNHSHPRCFPYQLWWHSIAVLRDRITRSLQPEHLLQMGINATPLFLLCLCVASNMLSIAFAAGSRQ